MLECLGLTGAKCLDPERLLAHAEQGADLARVPRTFLRNLRHRDSSSALAVAAARLR